MTDYIPWFIVVFILGWILALFGTALGWAFRKPGVTMSVLIGGYPDEPGNKEMSHSRRILSYVQDDKRTLVLWILFVAEGLLLADVLAALIFVLALF